VARGNNNGDNGNGLGSRRARSLSLSFPMLPSPFVPLPLLERLGRSGSRGDTNRKVDDVMHTQRAPIKRHRGALIGVTASGITTTSVIVVMKAPFKVYSAFIRYSLTNSMI
jgi:hypothetical protein